MNRSFFYSVAVAVGLMMAGCQSHSAQADPYANAQKVPPPVPIVQPAPPASAIPLDAQALQTARQIIQSDCDSTDEFIRSNALEALGDVDPNDAATHVLKGLNDPQAPVRFSAAIVAGKLQLKSAYEILLAMTQDSDKRVQAAVRYALHRLGNSQFSHDLENLSTDPDPSVRANTATVLGLLDEPSAVNLLLTMAHDPNSNVRLSVAEAIWEHKDEQALGGLVATSTLSENPGEQIVALIALARPGDRRVIPNLHGQLTGEYPEVCLAAARALGMLGSDAGWNVAVPQISSAEARQRSLAALALGAIGRSDAQPMLEKLLDDKDVSVRLSAATAILQLRPPAVASSR